MRGRNRGNEQQIVFPKKYACSQKKADNKNSKLMKLITGLNPVLLPTNIGRKERHIYGIVF